MLAKISKIKHSQGIRISIDIIEKLNHHNENLDQIEIKPFKKEFPSYNLEELISNIPIECKMDDEFITSY